MSIIEEKVVNIENVSILIEGDKIINLEDFLTDILINEFIELFTTISTLLGDLRRRTLKLLNDNKDINDNNGIKSPITAPILKLSFDYLGKIVDKFHSDEGSGDLIENIYNIGLFYYIDIYISIIF